MKKIRLAASVLLLLLIAGVQLLTAQNNDGVDAAAISQVDEMLNNALSAAEQGNWDQALAILDNAERIDSDDSRIASYRTSILELQALDAAQISWIEGDSSEVKPVESDSGTDNSDPDESPKFVIDRGDRNKENNPANFRDNFRGDLSVKIFAVNPVNSETVNTWSSGGEFFYSSFGADARYWMPILGKSLGFNFRSSGYSWAPGSPDVLFNSLDLGINLRGFLLEQIFSRLELGIDFGVSFHSTENLDTGSVHDGALFLGLWVSDPLMFHIFRTESLENLVFGGGLRIYSSTAEDLAETVNYRVEGAWYFNRGYTGVRLEWWDFTVESGPVSMLSFSLFGGFRY